MDTEVYITHLRAKRTAAKNELVRLSHEIKAAKRYYAKITDAVEKERMADRIGVLTNHFNGEHEEFLWCISEMKRLRQDGANLIHM